MNHNHKEHIIKIIITVMLTAIFALVAINVETINQRLSKLEETTHEIMQRVSHIEGALRRTP